MPLYLAIGFDDQPASIETRKTLMNAHRDYVRGNDAAIRLVGPLLDDDKGTCGSMFIFEADSPAEIRAWFDQEPFYRAGVYREVVIRGFFAGKNELPLQGWPH
jgi:uncharacterized protein YciI